jgi:hypothetical protein
VGRQVRGMLFVDYVRMLRAQRDRAWTVFFPSEDLRFFEEKIDVNGWYPMATFERLGIVVLHLIAKNEFHLVREWGRQSVKNIAQNVDQLVVPDDPRESLMRFQVFRRTFFDFEALSVLQVSDGAAQLQISYGMSSAAEQAASIQTMGFCEGLIDLARGRSIKAGFSERSWEGDPHTVLNLSWEHPATSA